MKQMYLFPNLASVYAKLSTLQGTDAGQGANLIGVQDAGSKFVGDTVEEVLTELDTHITNLTATDIAYTDTYEAGAIDVQSIIDVIIAYLVTIDSTYVYKDGDTMIGALIVEDNITADSFSVGATAGIDATIPIAPVLPLTVAGSATFTKGILTDYTAPSQEFIMIKPKKCKK